MRHHIERLSGELEQLHQRGQRWIKIELLSKVLRSLLSEDPTKQPDLQALHYQLTHQTKMDQWKEERETDRLLLQAVMQFAGGALKVITWMCGGAAVACLAYAANVRDGRLLESLLHFTSGLLLGAVAHGGAYLAQFNYAQGNEKTGNLFRAISIVLVLLAYGLFTAGMLRGYYDLRSGG